MHPARSPAHRAATHALEGCPDPCDTCRGSRASGISSAHGAPPCGARFPRKVSVLAYCLLLKQASHMLKCYGNPSPKHPSPWFGVMRRFQESSSSRGRRISQPGLHSSTRFKDKNRCQLHSLAQVWGGTWSPMFLLRSQGLLLVWGTHCGNRCSREPGCLLLPHLWLCSVICLL